MQLVGGVRLFHGLHWCQLQRLRAARLLCVPFLHLVSLLVSVLFDSSLPFVLLPLVSFAADAGRTDARLRAPCVLQLPGFNDVQQPRYTFLTRVFGCRIRNFLTWMVSCVFDRHVFEHGRVPVHGPVRWRGLQSVR